MSFLDNLQDDQRGAREGQLHHHYEIDDEEVKTVLRAIDYGGDEDGAWVLLETVGSVGAAGGDGASGDGGLAPVGGPSDE